MIQLCFLFHFFLTASLAAPISGGGALDPATFEAVTGDSPDEDKALWDSFYKRKVHSTYKEPVSFLKEHIHLVPKGRAFVPAMGEGRNAIFLAKRGFTVDGNDISEVAVDHAIHEAKLQKVSIHGIVADLNKYSYPENYYDLIMVSYFYSPTLVPKLKKALKPGGYLMFYERVKTVKPQKMSTPDDFLVSPTEIKTQIKDYKVKIYKEYKDHGIEVLGVLAQKPA